MRRMNVLATIVAAASVGFAGCSGSSSPKTTLTLATTTSTQDSGLLDALLPPFREQTGIEVKVVAVGTGQALELGRRGDADVLLTHAPDAEEQLMAEGWGVERRPVMHNAFVLVGPPTDPASVRETTTIGSAFLRIAQRQAPFISRGDDSGTHKKELEIWDRLQHEPEGDWYVRAGAGMAQALRMANEKQAYALADRGTYLALREEIESDVVSEGDPLLKNRYSVIIVNPERHAHVNVAAARAFADFLRGDQALGIIARFGVDRFGEPLFTPAGE